MAHQGILFQLISITNEYYTGWGIEMGNNSTFIFGLFCEI